MVNRNRRRGLRRKLYRCHTQLELLESRVVLAGTPIISEFLAVNDSQFVDEDGEYSDWIEIHNPTDESINLGEWSLTDDETDLTKWSFPDVDLGPHEFKVVFASTKDRTDSQSELHTNFRLSRDGEYLALVQPNGDVATDFGESYPQQEDDVAYGMATDSAPLVSDSTPLKYSVPSFEGSDLGTTWTEPGFDDSAWAEATAAIGFDQRAFLRNAGFEDQSFDGWETLGTVSIEDATLGTPPTEGLYHGVISSANAPARAEVEEFLDLTPRTLNALFSSSEQLVDIGFSIDVLVGSAIKRTLDVEAGTTIRFDWNYVSGWTPWNTPWSNLQSYDFPFVTITGLGTSRLASVDNILDSDTKYFGETGYFTFEHTFDEAGSYTLGLGIAEPNFLTKSSVLLVDNFQVNGVGSLDDRYESVTDLSQDMFNQNSSIYVRYEFDVADADSISSLLLRANYDDGMAVYLNGGQVAQRNAPLELDGVSHADDMRDNSQALVAEDIYLPTAGELLVDGRNILAIHGLNSSVADEDFLLQVELAAVGDMAIEPLHLTEPTPGAPNTGPAIGYLDQIRFDADSGFKDSSFLLSMTINTPDATIRYTTDGSAPTQTNGFDYTGPIAIDGTSVIRASGFKPGFVSRSVGTRSFFYVDQIVKQNNEDIIAAGYPELWNAEGLEADYAMDQRVIGPNGADSFEGLYADIAEQALTDIPTLSLVMDPNDMFGEETGIYTNPEGRGPLWERAVSVELIHPDGTEGFQEDAALRVQGGISRQIASKFSLRLLFKDEFGAGTLDYPFFGTDAAATFNSIALRSSSGEHARSLHYIRDEFARRSQLAMGNPSAHGTFMHLYINGIYWGMYNPAERLDSQFAANYFGGEPEDYDVLNAGDLSNQRVTIVAGGREAWDELVETALSVGAAETQADKNEIFYRLQGKNVDGTDNPEFESLLDVNNYIDYMILNLYLQNQDWPFRNFYMTRKRGPDSTGFKFLLWDSEFTMDEGNPTLHVDNLNFSTAPFPESLGPAIFLESLRTSDAFNVAFSDRVQQHFSPGGTLYVNPSSSRWDPERPQDNAAAARYTQLVEEIELALGPEAARWGDEAGQRVPLFTPDNQWQAQVRRNLLTFLPRRSSNLVTQFRSANLYTDGPQFSEPSGPLPLNTSVAIGGGGGDLYYTLDGSDPRNNDGSISRAARRFTRPLRINTNAVINARILSRDGWSAISSASYSVRDVPASSSNLRISEINYNPHDALTQFGDLDEDNDEFEFVELTNISDTTVNLQGVQFVRVDVGGDEQGVDFTFDTQTLEPGQRLVVPRNVAAFSSRYGDLVPLADGVGDDDSYSGRLGNGGERITLLDAAGELIQRITYDDGGEWPGRADGNGSTLELIGDLSGESHPEDYRNSSEFGGSPGGAGEGPSNQIVINEVIAAASAADNTIELLNSTGERIDLSRWYVSDDNDDYFKFRFPVGSHINAEDYLTLTSQQLGFGFSNSQSNDAYLISADTTGRPVQFIDRVEFNATETGVSLGRWPNGQGRLFPMNGNSFGAVNSGPELGDVVISEIYHSPEDPDGALGSTDAATLRFVELYNRSSGRVDVSGWRLDGDVEYTIDSGTFLEAGQTLAVASFDPVLNPQLGFIFRLSLGMGESDVLAGPYVGHLPPNSGHLELERPSSLTDRDAANILIDEVNYESTGDWPSDAMGSGKSLTRVSGDSYGDFSSSWSAVKHTPGSFEQQTSLDGDFTGDQLVDVADLELMCGALHTDASLLFDVNADGTFDKSDLDQMVEAILGTAFGDTTLDGVFDSGDLVAVFSEGDYEDGQGDSNWSSGDWNCDGQFDTSDLVAAFAAGGYVAASTSAAIGMTPSDRLSAALAESDTSADEPTATASMKGGLSDQGTSARPTPYRSWRSILETRHEANNVNLPRWTSNASELNNPRLVESSDESLVDSDVIEQLAMEQPSRHK